MSTRQRSNSVIPIELIKDEANGGIERAALATVFGVKEYTETKLPWNNKIVNLSTVIPRESLSLPLIPNVSGFGDLWQNSSIVESEIDEPKENMLHPLDLSGYSTIIFDIVKADDSNPCISWQRTSCHPTHEPRKRSRWSTELLFPKTQEQVLNKEEPQREIEAATLEKLVEKLTISLDYTFMTDFFLIYRLFTTPIQLLKYLMLRYKWSLEKEEEERYIVRIRAFVVIRHWLSNYFLHDFVPDKELRFMITKFLNDMSLNPTVKKSLRDKRIIQSLKRVVQRLKKIYYTSSTPVKVIEPPSPTDEQKRVNMIIKNSLNKTTLQQKFQGIHVDSRHGANTAIRDQQTAQIRLIGSLKCSPSFSSPLRPSNQSTSSLSTENSSNKTRQPDQSSCLSLETDLTPGNSEDEQDLIENEEISENLSKLDLKHSNSVVSLPLQQQQKFESAKKTQSFYNAHLAIPDISVSSSENMYPTAVENTVDDYMQTKKQDKKGLIYSNRVNKPLPALSTESSPAPSIQSDSDFREPPPREQWKLSIRNRGSDKSLKSRITEIDINLSTISKPASSLKPVYQSILLNYPTSVIVEQFCLIEKTVLLDVNWEELVDIRWTKMHAGEYLQYKYPMGDQFEHMTNPQPGIYSRAKRMRQTQEREQDGSERGVEKAIHRFNAVCQWVSSEIVQTRSIELRAKLIEKFIRLAKKCKMYCNFSTLIQILLGLQSCSVSRLTKTWSMVSKREMRILQKLSTFTSPTKNWKYLRDSMTQVAEEHGESTTEIQVEKLSKSTVTIKLPFGGCIPFLGIYLSDLVFNTELPSYMSSSYKPTRLKNSIESKVLSQPLVNFRKHRITASIIKKVLIFQGLAKRYSFEQNTNDILYSSCLHVVSLNTNEMQELSYQIEP